MDIYANNIIGKSTNSTCYGKGHHQNLRKTLEFAFHILNTRIISDRDLVLDFTFTLPSTREGYFPQFILDPPPSENIRMNWSVRASVSNKMSKTLTLNFAWNRNWLYDYDYQYILIYILIYNYMIMIINIHW